MPPAHTVTWMLWVVVCTAMKEGKTESVVKWMNLSTITLTPLNDHSYSQRKTAYWFDSTLEDTRGHEASRLDSKSTDVQHSIYPSTLSSAIHTWPSSSILYKETLNTSNTPVASTATFRGEERHASKAAEKAGGAGGRAGRRGEGDETVTVEAKARGKGPIISSLASVLALSYWQSQRKKCCLTRLCPCRPSQYPYAPGGGAMGPSFMPGEVPPFAPTFPMYPPGMYPGSSPPFRPGFGGAGNGGSQGSSGDSDSGGEEELLDGFQTSYHIVTRPTKRRRPLPPSAAHHQHYNHHHSRPTVLLRPISMSGLSSSAGGHNYHPINAGLVKWSSEGEGAVEGPVLPSSNVLSLSPASSSSSNSLSSQLTPSSSSSSSNAHSLQQFTSLDKLASEEAASSHLPVHQTQVDSRVKESFINNTKVVHSRYKRTMKGRQTGSKTTRVQIKVRSRRKSPILPVTFAFPSKSPVKHSMIRARSSSDTLNRVNVTVASDRLKVTQGKRAIKRWINDTEANKKARRATEKRHRRSSIASPGGISSGTITGESIHTNGHSVRKSSNTRDVSTLRGVRLTDSSKNSSSKSIMKGTDINNGRGGGIDSLPGRKNGKKRSSAQRTMKQSPAGHSSRRSQRDRKGQRRGRD